MRRDWLRGHATADAIGDSIPSLPTRAGRIPGGRCYGYDVVTDGLDRGRRVVNEAEAQIVRRIFAEYVAGRSPLAIAGRLNREGVPGPRGRLWKHSTILGAR